MSLQDMAAQVQQQNRDVRSSILAASRSQSFICGNNRELVEPTSAFSQNDSAFRRHRAIRIRTAAQTSTSISVLRSAFEASSSSSNPCPVVVHVVDKKKGRILEGSLKVLN